MTLLRDDCKISDIVSYSFWKTQYGLRCHPDTTRKPSYNPTSTTLCKDLSRGVKKDPGALHTRPFAETHNCEIISDDSEHVTVKISKRANIKLIASEIEFMMYIFSRTRVMENGERQVCIDEEFLHLSNSLARMNISCNAKISFNEKHWGSRALGLWLWDYVKEHGGTIIGAIRALKEQLGPEVDELGFSISEDNVFRRFYRKTAECIDACEVLPFK